MQNLALERKKMTIDTLIKQLRHLYTIKEIRMGTLEYHQFHDALTNFIFENHLDETAEWRSISDKLIYKSTQYLVRQEADSILVNLEKLKRLLLKKQVNYDIIFQYIHPEILNVSKQKFIDGHNADAVESAFKEINTRVKQLHKTICPNQPEVDGTSGMYKVFSGNNPILQFEDILTESGKNVQDGYAHIFAGSIQAIRNPKAHANITITKENALRKLMIASDLMYKIDEALEYKRNHGSA